MHLVEAIVPVHYQVLQVNATSKVLVYSTQLVGVIVKRRRLLASILSQRDIKIGVWFMQLVVMIFHVY
jgi:hypothetical protein